jgi:hypothetical protein
MKTESKFQAKKKKTIMCAESFVFFFQLNTVRLRLRRRRRHVRHFSSSFENKLTGRTTTRVFSSVVVVLSTES